MVARNARHWSRQGTLAFVPREGPRAGPTPLVFRGPPPRAQRIVPRGIEDRIMANKVWFITGTSRGFGREWATAALERGDKVAATARDTSALDDLVKKYGAAILPIALDVQDRAADFAAVKRAADTFGRLDIVINNAGYGQFGMIEELSEKEAREQIETNVFGAMWVTQAALPYLRQQKSGHIIQVSSIGGISAFPNVGAYHASKWALEGFSQALSLEVKDFGIHVTLIEPGGFLDRLGWLVGQARADQPGV